MAYNFLELVNEINRRLNKIKSKKEADEFCQIYISENKRWNQ